MKFARAIFHVDYTFYYTNTFIISFVGSQSTKPEFASFAYVLVHIDNCTFRLAWLHGKTPTTQLLVLRNINNIN
jgi:hypothetical protein